MPDQLADPLRDHSGLKLLQSVPARIFEECAPVRIFLLCLGDEDLRIVLSAVRLRIGCPAEELRIPVIVNASDLPAHDLPEETVGKVEDFLSAPEILKEIDPDSAGYGIVSPLPCVIVKLLHKKIRSRMSEAINALLDISDAEIIIAAFLHPCHCGKDRLLQVVAVLILVHHDALKISRKLFRSVCAFSVLVPQDL